MKNLHSGLDESKANKRVWEFPGKDILGDPVEIVLVPVFHKLFLPVTSKEIFNFKAREIEYN